VLNRVKEQLHRGEAIHYLKLRAHCIGVFISMYHKSDKRYMVRACSDKHVILCVFEEEKEDCWKRVDVISLGNNLSSLKKLEMLFIKSSEEILEEEYTSEESNYII